MSHQIKGTGIAAVSAAALDAAAPDAAMIVGSTWLRALSRDADRAGRHTPIERRLPLLRPLGLLARPPAAHTERPAAPRSDALAVRL